MTQFSRSVFQGTPARLLLLCVVSVWLSSSVLAQQDVPACRVGHDDMQCDRFGSKATANGVTYCCSNGGWPSVRQSGATTTATCPAGTVCELRPFEFMACRVGVNDVNCGVTSGDFCCPAESDPIQKHHTLPDQLELHTCSVPSNCVDRPKAVNGGWAPWGHCDSSCEQQRNCTNPAPAHGGAECEGESSRACPGGSCLPLAGGWSPWTTCAANCTQVRVCDNPAPRYGGAFCEGEESTSCFGGRCERQVSAASALGALAAIVSAMAATVTLYATNSF